MKKTALIYFIIWNCFSALSQTTVDAVLDSYKLDKDLGHALYSVCVLDASTGKLVKEYNSELAMVPASTLKVITTASALGILGKDFSYKTNFYIVQKGDSLSKSVNPILYVKGSGDPTFNSSYFYNSDSLFLNMIIKKIKEKGVTKLDRVSADASCFDSSIPGSWIWGDIGNYFGAGANGLSYKDNKFSLSYDSGAPNSIARLEKVKPDYFSKKMSIESKVLCAGTEDEAYVYGDPTSYTRIVKGVIPPSRQDYEVEAQMPNPPLFFEYELREELKKQNVLVNDNGNLGSTLSVKLTAQDQLIYSHVSPKLDKIVYYTNIKSNNHYAESLLKTIGNKNAKQGTTDNGITAIKTYWKERSVDMSGLHMVDGSGLSRANTVTTKIQATILSKMYRDSVNYKVFNASLPVAGKSGSMASLCKGTFAENNLRAKTGYINRARAYCGYVKTKSGKELAFSIIFNNYDCSAKEMKLKIEKFLVALVDL